MQLLLDTRPHAANRSDRPAQWPAVARPASQPPKAKGISADIKDAALKRCRFDRINDGDRGSTESFIATQFNKAYGAKITEFMPELMGLYDNDALAAACGLRAAATGPMFLEQYLEYPLEAVLGRATGTQIERRTLVEVGNLSISRPGYARHLLCSLTMHLRNIGMQWAVFSAVPTLRNNFQRLGIPLITMAPASPDKLPANIKASWGTYYDQQPQVTAVSVEAAFKALDRNSCNR